MVLCLTYIFFLFGVAAFEEAGKYTDIGGKTVYDKVSSVKVEVDGSPATYYSNLYHAVESVKVGGVANIVVLKDIEETKTINIIDGKQITISSQSVGVNIKHAVNSSLFKVENNSSLTVGTDTLDNGKLIFDATDNILENDGGFFDNDGNLTINNGTFKNLATTGNGGVVLNKENSDLIINGGVFENNQAGNGGFIFHNGNTLKLSGNIISNGNIYLPNGKSIMAGSGLAIANPSNFNKIELVPQTTSVGTILVQTTYSLNLKELFSLSSGFENMIFLTTQEQGQSQLKLGALVTLSASTATSADFNGWKWDNSKKTFQKEFATTSIGTLPVDLQKNGYELMGWFTHNIGGNQVVDNQTIISENITLYAQWQVIEYQIEYLNLKGAQNTNPIVYTIESNEIVFLPLENVEGWTFVGWDIPKITTNSFGNKTITAIWDEVIVLNKVSLHAGENAVMNAMAGWNVLETNYTKQLAPGAELGELPQPNKPGYEFLGWWTSTVGGDLISDLTTMPAYDVTYYAQWKQYENTIYIVEHYQEDIEGSTYTLIDTEELSGVTDTTVVADVKNYVGFTENINHDDRLASGIISGEGTLVLRLYYDRKVYLIELTSTEGILNISGEGSYRYGATATINVALMTGYEWVNWTGSSIIESQSYSFTVTESAAWQANAQGKTVTVLLANNPLSGGSVSKSGIERVGQTITLTPTAENGYYFNDWSIDNSVNLVIGNMFEIHADDAEKTITITANWEAIVYNIVYLDTKDAINNNPNSYTINSSVTFEALEDVEGFRFIGWTPASIAIGSTGQKNIKAEWEEIEYEARLNAGDNAIMKAMTGWNISGWNYTKQLVLGAELGALPVPELEGYEFLGWWTATIGGDLISNLTTMPAHDVTYYAQWKEYENTTYTVEHYVMDTSGNYPTTATETENKTGITDSSLTLENLKDTDLEVAGGITYKQAEVEGVVVTTTTILPNGSRVIKLYYERSQYTLTLKAGTGIYAVTNGSESSFTEITKTYYFAEEVLIEALTDAGYSWVNWTGTKTIQNATVIYTITAQNITLTANAQPISYSISYDLVGGELTSGDINPSNYNVETSDFTLKNPTKLGYTFQGWTGTDLADLSSSVKIEKGSTGNRSYTANWAEVEYIVTLDARAGATLSIEHGWTVNGTVYSKSIIYNNQIGALPEPVKEGYTFNGWFTNQSGGVKINETRVVSYNSSDNLFYAQWTAYTYEVFFNGNGNTGGGGEFPSQVFTYGSGQKLDKNTYTKHGYTFIGWALSADGGVEYEDEEVLNIAEYQEMIDLWAVWEINTYTLTLNSNGGSGGTSSVVVTHMSSTLPSITKPTREGYVFGGWTTVKDGNQVVISSDETPVLVANIDGYTDESAKWIRTIEPTTLYAKWIEVIFKYTFQAVDGGYYSVDGFADGVTGVKELTGSNAIPSSYGGFPVMMIGYGAFSGTGLTKINIPNSIKYIGNYSFSRTLLTEINIPNSVEVIGTSAFSEVYNLKSVTFGTGVRTINSYAFASFGGGSGEYYSPVVTARFMGITPPTDVGSDVFGSIWMAGLSSLEALVVPSSSYISAYQARFTQYSTKVVAYGTTTISFNKQNGSGGSSSVSVAIGASMPSATAPTRASYIFKGYYDATSGGTQYYTATMQSARPWDKIGTSATLYAQWEYDPSPKFTDTNTMTFDYVDESNPPGMQSRFVTGGSGNITIHREVVYPSTIVSFYLHAFVNQTSGEVQFGMEIMGDTWSGADMVVYLVTVYRDEVKGNSFEVTAYT